MAINEKGGKEMLTKKMEKNAEYVLTATGEKKAKAYLAELAAKRKEILDAGKDTADDTDLPTVEDIIADVNWDGLALEEEGIKEYCNGWAVTDHYEADYPLLLKFGKDLMYSEEYDKMPEDAGTQKWVKTDDLQWARVEAYNSSNDPIYDMIEVRDVGEEYHVVRGTIDIKDYPADDLISIIQGYGYPDVQSVREQYPGNHVQVIAECIFECTAESELVAFGPFASEDEAEAYVEKQLLHTKSYSVKCFYSWGDEEEFDKTFRSVEEAFAYMCESAAKEAYAYNEEREECRTSTIYVDAADLRVDLHYDHDDTWCLYRIVLMTKGI